MVSAAGRAARQGPAERARPAARAAARVPRAGNNRVAGRARPLVDRRADADCERNRQATTPTTKVDVNALPTSRNGLRLSSNCCLPVSGSTRSSPEPIDGVGFPQRRTPRTGATGRRPVFGVLRIGQSDRGGLEGGRIAAARAAPRASAISGSSGALTGNVTRFCRWALTAPTPMPEPTTKMPCGGELAASTAVAISVSTAIASSLCSERLSTLTTEPSSGAPPTASRSRGR